MAQVDTATILTLTGVCQAYNMRPVDQEVVEWVGTYPDVLTWASDVAQQLPVVSHPQVDPLAMRRLVGQAGEAMIHPVGQLVVYAQVGRVFEVLAVPHITTAKDPLFPICLAPLSTDYRACLQQYVQALLAFPTDSGWGGRNRNRWYAQATDCLWPVVDQLAVEAADILAWQELVFLLVVLDYARAAPLGHAESDGHAWESNVLPGQVALWRMQ